MKLPNYADISEGFELPIIKKDPITQLQLIRYAGASGDFNQIHTVPEYAKKAGLDGAIAHGNACHGNFGAGAYCLDWNEADSEI